MPFIAKSRAGDDAVAPTALIVGCDPQATAILGDLLSILGWAITGDSRLPSRCGPCDLLMIGELSLLAEATARRGRDWKAVVIVTSSKEAHDVSALSDGAFVMFTPIDISDAEQIVVAAHPQAVISSKI